MEDGGLSTGLPGLDEIIGGILPGDNVVWQVDDIEEYLPFVKPYCERAVSTGKPLIYFRFASHQPLVPEGSGARVYGLHPEEGFESFLLGVHRVIERSGRGAFYIFDCLSDLVADWYSDQMLANFFVLTCPYLYDLQTVAYFPLLRNRHSSYATSPIMETTQLFLSVYRSGGDLYLRPLRVLHRHSATMCMLHAWTGSKFVPVAESAVTSEILSSVPWPQLQSGGLHLDMWNRTFADARRAYDEWQKGSGSEDELAGHFYLLLRMAISRDPRTLDLCRKYLKIADILELGERIVGTGLIGGKSVGMLLSRGILKEQGERWERLLEKHDSFYIASDVFYTYLVRNGCWWGRESQRSPDTFLKGASEMRRQILRGAFPDFLLKQFADMLDYYGQSPIIVRSSSLLEDGFGHVFAGKYESVFCANQGPESKRMEDFLAAVRTIYASTLSEDALRYRAQHGLLDREEQMALLVQRVSGSVSGDLFYPHLAGVAFSFNPYVWSREIDPKAGVARMVFGLGTRALDRSDGDYTRLVALAAPEKSPEDRLHRVGQCTQRKVDVLDLRANLLASADFSDVVRRSAHLEIEDFASRDPEIARQATGAGLEEAFPWVLTFDGVLSKTPLARDMREILRALQEAYDCPVDVEFTANILSDRTLRINLVQCRPLQGHSGEVIPSPPPNVKDEDCVIGAQLPMIGRSRVGHIDRLIYVVPSVYGRLPEGSRHSIARLIGEITRLKMPREKSAIMLIGPGQWGSATPSLGVPVSFGEISEASVLCGIASVRDDLTPEVFLRTHFFADLVEVDMLYVTLFPGERGSFVNQGFFQAARNKLAQLRPGASEAELAAVKVIDVEDVPMGRVLKLYANAVERRVVCYFCEK